MNVLSGAGARWALRAVLVSLAIGLLTLPTASAATVAGTTTASNEATAAGRLLPPTQVLAVVSREGLSLTCRTVVSWAASVSSMSAAPVGYEVRRVDRVTGAVAAGPWAVERSPFTDGPFTPLLSSRSDWQVRTVRPGAFDSTWVTSATSYQGICAL